MVMLDVSGGLKTRVADPALRREVEAAVRRRVRGEDAEDLVQATLADVLSAAHVPDEPEEFRRFVFGVARHKVFDHFRRQKRRTAGLGEDDLAAPEAPLSARDILRWAEGELRDPDAQSTLEWMLREGDGEKLEHIAQGAGVPATRVRKRVSRLRKLLRERWAAELTLVGLLLLLSGLGALYWYARGRTPDDVVEREPPRPLPSAPRELPSARPAGSAAPIPNLVRPEKASPAPSTSGSAEPRARSKKLTPTPRSLSTELPLAPPSPKAVKAPSKAGSELDGSLFDAPQKNRAAPRELEQKK